MAGDEHLNSLLVEDVHKHVGVIDISYINLCLVARPGLAALINRACPSVWEHSYATE